MRLKRTGQDGAAYLLYFVSGSFYGCVCLHSLTIIYTHTHLLADESQCKLLHFPACVCDFVEDIWKFRHYLEWKRTWIERRHDSSDFHMWLHFYLFFAVVLGSLRTHVTHTHTPHTDGSNQATYLPQPSRLSRLSRRDIKQGRSDKPWLL